MDLQVDTNALEERTVSIEHVSSPSPHLKLRSHLIFIFKQRATSNSKYNYVETKAFVSFLHIIYTFDHHYHPALEGDFTIGSD